MKCEISCQIIVDNTVHTTGKSHLFLLYILVSSHVLVQALWHCKTATHCNTLQHTATHCDTLRHTATHCNTLHRGNVWQFVELKTITLQCTATHCNTHTHLYIYMYGNLRLGRKMKKTRHGQIRLFCRFSMCGNVEIGHSGFCAK